MFDVHSYLRDEFRRYFPSAERIDVHQIDETWVVGIHDTPKSDAHLTLTMNVGSDDDCFRFTSQFGSVYTVPFSEDME